MSRLKVRFVWMLIPPIIFVPIGFGILGFGLVNAWRSMRAATWPTVAGTISQLSVAEDRGGENTTYQLNVRYTYAVAGVRHDGSRVAFGYAGSAERHDHEDIYRKLKNAKAVAVRYSPSDPSVSCLSCGLHRTILLLVGFAFLWLSFWFWWIAAWWTFQGSGSLIADNLLVE